MREKYKEEKVQESLNIRKAEKKNLTDDEIKEQIARIYPNTLTWRQEKKLRLNKNKGKLIVLPNETSVGMDEASFMRFLEFVKEDPNSAFCKGVMDKYAEYKKSGNEDKYAFVMSARTRLATNAEDVNRSKKDRHVTKKPLGYVNFEPRLVEALDPATLPPKPSPKAKPPGSSEPQGGTPPSLKREPSKPDPTVDSTDPAHIPPIIHSGKSGEQDEREKKIIIPPVINFISVSAEGLNSSPYPHHTGSSESHATVVVSSSGDKLAPPNPDEAISGQLHPTQEGEEDAVSGTVKNEHDGVQPLIPPIDAPAIQSVVDNPDPENQGKKKGISAGLKDKMKNFTGIGKNIVGEAKKIFTRKRKGEEDNKQTEPTQNPANTQDRSVAKQKEIAEGKESDVSERNMKATRLYKGHKLTWHLKGQAGPFPPISIDEQTHKITYLGEASKSKEIWESRLKSSGEASIASPFHDSQDRTLVRSKYTSNPETSFFGIFDGHGRNASVAEYAQNELDEQLRLILRDGRDSIEEALTESFIDINKHVESYDSGSTATVALSVFDKLYIANVGDSRAVLDSEGIAQRISKDHKPDDPDELERIKLAGGKVVKDGVYRVLDRNFSKYSGLAISRALGDAEYTHAIAEPHIASITLTKGNERLILASDGLWDVFEDQEAVDFIKDIKNSKEAAEKLATNARERGSNDDISVIVVDFKDLKK